MVVSLILGSLRKFNKKVIKEGNTKDITKRLPPKRGIV